jgi:hypothetical protein
MGMDSEISAATPERPKYCRTCGASLPSEGDMCESCGAAVPVAPKVAATEETPLFPPLSSSPLPTQQNTWRQGDVVDALANPHLPDPNVPPRLSRALSLGWEMLMDDVVSGVVTSLIFVVLSSVGSQIAIIGDLLITAPLTVGFMGWAEARRQALPGSQGALFSVGYKYFRSSIYLRLVSYLVAVAGTIPAGILAFGFTSLLGGLTGNPSPTPTFNPALTLLTFIPIGILVLIAPSLTSMITLSSWAIARGVPFKPAFGWAWQRIKKYPIRWWWAGLVGTLASSIGLILLFVGVFLTVPWIALASAEIASYEGEPSDDATIL